MGTIYQKPYLTDWMNTPCLWIKFKKLQQNFEFYPFFWLIQRLTMIEALLKGIALGLIIAMMIGPVFFFIISTSIKKGFLTAFLAALGVLLSDACFILLAYFGSSLLFYFHAHEQTVAIAGGILIAAYGLYLIIKQARVSARSLELPEDKSGKTIYLLKGFLLNAINPSVLLFWMVVASTIPVREQFSANETLLFFAGTLATVLMADLAKTYSATRLRSLLHARVLIWMNRLAGSAMIIYGISMFLFALNGNI
jgi:threonine/homoserine/homoserine lactone efflux protein